MKEKEKDILIDTMILINNITNNNFKKVCFSELSVFEMFKNKDLNNIVKQLNHLYCYVKKSNSEMIFSKKCHINIFKNESYDNLMKYALNMCDDIAKHIGTIYIEFSGILIYFMCIFKMQRLLTEEYKKDFEDIMSSIKITSDFISRMKIDEISDSIKKESTEILDDLLFKRIINIYIEKINELSINKLFRFKPLKKLNTNEITFANNLIVTEDEIDKNVDNIILFKNNNYISKEFYKVYLKDIFLKHNSITLNDFIDMELIKTAIDHNLVFISKDKRIKQKFSSIIDKYLSNNFILLCN